MVVLMIVSTTVDWYRFDAIDRAIVVRDGAVIRKGDSETYESLFTEGVPAGTDMRIRGSRGDWLLVELDSEQTGWIKSRDTVAY